jgi:hypothetical protein
MRILSLFGAVAEAVSDAPHGFGAVASELASQGQRPTANHLALSRSGWLRQRRDVRRHFGTRRRRRCGEPVEVTSVTLTALV